MAYDLEVIAQLPQGPARPTPLVFVHGAFAGAWVWESHFLPYFARHGYASYALSLRGHGASAGRERLMQARLKDYVEDVESVIARLPAPPVLIGHSMGGVVVQHVLHRRAVPAAVLMGSGPPHGLIGCWFNMLVNHPRLLTQLSLMQLCGPFAVDVEPIRRALFSDDTPDEVFLRALPRMEAESPWVVLDLWGLDLPPSRRLLDLPVLVLGAENDAFISRGAVEATAWTYRTTAEILPHVAHAMMLDHHWEQIAGRMLGWLEGALAGSHDAARAAA